MTASNRAGGVGGGPDAAAAAQQQQQQHSSSSSSSTSTHRRRFESVVYHLSYGMRRVGQSLGGTRETGQSEEFDEEEEEEEEEQDEDANDNDDVYDVNDDENAIDEADAEEYGHLSGYLTLCMYLSVSQELSISSLRTCDVYLCVALRSVVKCYVKWEANFVVSVLTRWSDTLHRELELFTKMLSGRKKRRWRMWWRARESQRGRNSRGRVVHTADANSAITVQGIRMTKKGLRGVGVCPQKQARKRMRTAATITSGEPLTDTGDLS